MLNNYLDCLHFGSASDSLCKVHSCFGVVYRGIVEVSDLNFYRDDFPLEQACAQTGSARLLNEDRGLEAQELVGHALVGRGRRTDVGRGALEVSRDGVIADAESTMS